MRVIQGYLLGLLLCGASFGLGGCSDDDPKGPDGAGQADGGPSADTTSSGCSATMTANEACGGELTGEWRYDQACFDPDVVMGAIKVVCPTASGSQFSIMLAAGAALSFTATDYDLAVKTDVAFHLNIPVECATTLGGCATVETMITTGFSTNGIDGTATCTDLGGACDCALAFTFDIAGTGSYTAADGKITLDDGSEYYYCISSGELRYHGVAGSAADEAAGYTLSPAQP